MIFIEHQSSEGCVTLGECECNHFTLIRSKKVKGKFVQLFLCFKCISTVSVNTRLH